MNFNFTVKFSHLFSLTHKTIASIASPSSSQPSDIRSSHSHPPSLDQFQFQFQPNNSIRSSHHHHPSTSSSSFPFLLRETTRMFPAPRTLYQRTAIASIHFPATAMQSDFVGLVATQSAISQQRDICGFYLTV